MSEKETSETFAVAVILGAVFALLLSTTVLWAAVNAVAYSVTEWRLPWVSAFGANLLLRMLTGQLRRVEP